MKKINWQLLWKIIIIIIIIIIITIVVITDSECKIENNNCLTLFLNSDYPIPCKLNNFQKFYRKLLQKMGYVI